MSVDLAIVAGGAAVGFVVGMTGMGGGALMTPMLVFFFNINPLTAVSSDLVASLFMKPVGALVHLRRGTVHMELVRYLCIGSVPTAFLGVLVVRWLGELGDGVDQVVKIALGVALLVAVGAMLAKGLLSVRRHGASAREPGTPASARQNVLTVRPRVTSGDRCGRWSRRRHDVGRLRVAHHRVAAADLSAAHRSRTRRDRSGAGRAVGRVGGIGAHAVR